MVADLVPAERNKHKPAFAGCSPGGCPDSGQAQSKMVNTENRSGAYLIYVSTRSGGISHFQAGLT